MRNLLIKDTKGMQVFDSRGNPTIQVTVELEDGTTGCSMVPSGASTGTYEAIELRDSDFEEYNGLGVSKAVENVNKKIAKAINGMNVYDQNKIDETMIKLDGTKNKSKLGANAILGTSLAVANTAANSLKMPLYRYIGGINSKVVPIPFMNILNGGKHSDNNVNIQEIMIIPTGGKNFKEYIQIGTEVYHELKGILREKNLSTAVGDEGGFAPIINIEEGTKTKILGKKQEISSSIQSDEKAIELVIEAITKAGFEAGKDVMLALDIASSEMREEAKGIEKEGYYFWKTGEYKTKSEMIDYIEYLTSKYPIVSVEDGLAEDDWKDWKELTERIGKRTQLVGDDVFVTNKSRLEKGIKNKVANSILIKPNQIGSLTETLETIEMAKENGYKIIVSHRSGETEDTFIADLAVAVNAGQIKMGAPCRTDRVAKYNRMLNIENDIK